LGPRVQAREGRDRGTDATSESTRARCAATPRNRCAAKASPTARQACKHISRLAHREPWLLSSTRARVALAGCSSPRTGGHDDGQLLTTDAIRLRNGRHAPKAATRRSGSRSRSPRRSRAGGVPYKFTSPSRWVFHPGDVAGTSKIAGTLAGHGPTPWQRSGQIALRSCRTPVTSHGRSDVTGSGPRASWRWRSRSMLARAVRAGSRHGDELRIDGVCWRLWSWWPGSRCLELPRISSHK